MDTEWIETGLRQPGKSKTGLAKALGRAPSAVTALLNGKRQIKAREVAIIVAYLGQEPESHAFKAMPPIKIGYVQVIGEVAGGVWSEPNLHFEQFVSTIPLDAKYPGESVYALRIRGTSINRRADDGDLVLCLRLDAAPRTYQPGDWVIAERDRDGMIETTVKRVGSNGKGGLTLWPDSNDPQFQTPLTLGESESETVTIRAFVLDFVKQATRF